MLNAKQKTQKLYFSKLRYIETEDRVIILHYESKVLRHRCGITSFMNELPEHTFFRCNHSYIVNLKYVDYITPDINRFIIHLITVKLNRNVSEAQMLSTFHFYEDRIQHEANNRQIYHDIQAHSNDTHSYLAAFYAKSFSTLEIGAI